MVQSALPMHSHMACIWPCIALDVFQIHLVQAQHTHTISCTCCTADAPGMKGDDIHVELHDNVLRVSGEKSSQHQEENKGNKVWRQERSFQKFQRSFQLPEDAKADGIAARMENGVLTVDVSGGSGF